MIASVATSKILKTKLINLKKNGEHFKSPMPSETHKLFSFS